MKDMPALSALAPRRRSALRAAPILLMALLVVTACSRSEKPEAACPQGVIPADSASVTRFRDGPGRDLTDIIVEGEIVNILVQCKYDKKSVTVDLQIAVTGDRGPADRGRVAQFDYWVAILDPQQNIIAKQPGQVRFEFKDNRTRMGQILNEFEPYIPLADIQQAPSYQIVVGFQLTAEELAWNRSQKTQGAR
jgi:hypothetical protein